jgi:hypothetical protein
MRSTFSYRHLSGSADNWYRVWRTHRGNLLRLRSRLRQTANLADLRQCLAETVESKVDLIDHDPQPKCGRYRTMPAILVWSPAVLAQAQTLHRQAGVVAAKTIPGMGQLPMMTSIGVCRSSAASRSTGRAAANGILQLATSKASGCTPAAFGPDYCNTWRGRLPRTRTA